MAKVRIERMDYEGLAYVSFSVDNRPLDLQQFTPDQPLTRTDRLHLSMATGFPALLLQFLSQTRPPREASLLPLYNFVVAQREAVAAMEDVAAVSCLIQQIITTMCQGDDNLQVIEYERDVPVLTASR